MLLDTGPLAAILSATDQHHEPCVAAMRTLTRPPVTCLPVLTEAAWLLRSDVANVRKLISMWQNRIFTVAAIELEAAAWIDDFMSRYADQRPQLADATLMYLADRDHHDTILTLHQRDFSVCRKRDGAVLEMRPM